MISLKISKTAKHFMKKDINKKRRCRELNHFIVDK